MKYFLIFADCYPAPARHGIRELRDRIILHEFDEIHSIHFIEFSLWRTMSGVRSRDRRKRNRRQTEWNTGLVRIFLRCKGGKKSLILNRIIRRTDVIIRCPNLVQVIQRTIYQYAHSQHRQSPDTVDVLIHVKRVLKSIIDYLQI